MSSRHLAAKPPVTEQLARRTRSIIPEWVPVRQVVAEFLGTMLLVGPPTYAATMATTNNPIAGIPLGSSDVPLAFGAALALGIFLFAGISGAHFNPALTFALVLNRQISLKTAFWYWPAQLAGGLAGSALTHALAGRMSNVKTSGYGVTLPATGIDPVTAFIIEMIGTGLLAVAVAAAAVDKRTGIAPALVIGGTLYLAILVFGPATGGAFNPARALGPMITAGALDDGFVYVAAQLLGATLAMTAYLKFGRKDRDTQ